MRGRAIVVVTLGAFLLLACSSPSGSPTSSRLTPSPPTPAAEPDRCDRAGFHLWPGKLIDVDGDGVSDLVQIVREGPCDKLGSYRLQAVIAAGGGTVERGLAGFSMVGDFPGAMGAEAPYVIGGVDLDGDGVNEILAKTGGSAVHPFVGFFAVRNRQLDALRFENGRPAEFNVGDFVRKFRRGMACEPGAGIVRSYVADHIGAAWDPREVVITSYQMAGSVLQLVDQVRTADDEIAEDYYRINCSGLSLDPTS